MKTALVLAIGMSSCGGSGMPTTQIFVDGTAMRVEVAATEAHRTQGLMHRDKLGSNQGMLFVYEEAKVLGFWMKDTRIPLSIAFLDDQGEILRLADMPPLTTERTSSLYPAKYALEVNKGWFDEHGVEVGDNVTGLDELPPTPR